MKRILALFLWSWHLIAHCFSNLDALKEDFDKRESARSAVPPGWPVWSGNSPLELPILAEKFHLHRRWWQSSPVVELAGESFRSVESYSSVTCLDRWRLCHAAFSLIDRERPDHQQPHQLLQRGSWAAAGKIPVKLHHLRKLGYSVHWSTCALREYPFFYQDLLLLQMIWNSDPVLQIFTDSSEKKLRPGAVESRSLSYPTPPVCYVVKVCSSWFWFRYSEMPDENIRNRPLSDPVAKSSLASAKLVKSLKQRKARTSFLIKNSHSVESSRGCPLSTRTFIQTLQTLL